MSKPTHEESKGVNQAREVGRGLPGQQQADFFYEGLDSKYPNASTGRVMRWKGNFHKVKYANERAWLSFSS